MDMYRMLSSGITLALIGLSSTAFAATDADIQRCITDKLAAAPKLSTQGFSASVKNGAATLTGAAKNPGSKGAATGIAKRCNAVSVTNEITWEKAAKSAPASADEDTVKGAKTNTADAKSAPSAAAVESNAGDSVKETGKSKLKDALGSRAKGAAKAAAPAAMP